MVELKLNNNEKRYLLYYEFRLFFDETLILCSLDRKHIENIQLIDLINSKKVSKITINKNSDLILVFHDGCVLECLNISIVYTKWELNYELTCDASGEISYFCKSVKL